MSAIEALAYSPYYIMAISFLVISLIVPEEFHVP